MPNPVPPGLLGHKGGAGKELQAENGYEHPTTLRALSGLSSLLREAGGLQAALVHLEKTLADHPEFGPPHADTLMLPGTLASVRQELGHLHVAVRFWTDVSCGRHMAVGACHVDTIAAYAQVHQAQYTVREHNQMSGTSSGTRALGSAAVTWDRNVRNGIMVGEVSCRDGYHTADAMARCLNRHTQIISRVQHQSSRRSSSLLSS